MSINNVTSGVVEGVVEDGRHLGLTCQVVVTCSYCLGIIGNLLAIYTLYRSEYKYNKNKSILMLRCLAVNDLVALVGMLIQMNLQLIYPHFSHSYWFCVLRVFWRAFGLGSGCVAIVMAIERWLALTKPFLFKKYITYNVIKRAIFLVWLTGTALTCLPFAGFGLFFKDNSDNYCKRYRQATETKDIAYAYIYFTFGTMLCACIVWCNVGVIKELVKIGKRVPVRRISRSLSRTSNNPATHFNPTAEELAFAKLMAVLCISFVICWMPQMISIPMAQYEGNNESKFSHIFFRIADILMAVHFTLDPFVYVLLRFRKHRAPAHVDSALQPLSNSTQTASTKLSQDVQC